MTILQRLILTLIFSGAAITALFLFLFIYSQEQQKIIRNDSREQLQSEVNILIRMKTSTTDQVAYDYTFWNDFVLNIQTPDSVWFSANIGTIPRSYHMDYSCVFDSLFRLIYQSPGMGFPATDIISQEMLKALRRKRLMSYFSLIDGNLAEISAASVHPESDPSHMNTRPQGYLFIIRKWDRTFLNDLANMTSSTVRMVQGKDSLHPMAHLSITALHEMKGWGGQPVASLVFARESALLKIFDRSSVLMLSVTVFLLLTTGLILIFAFMAWIHHPLKLVKKILRTDSPTLISILQKGPGEFRDIGNLFLQSANQKKELKIAKEKAEEADRMKTIFLANMSHEIRTPMNGILGFTSLLKDPDFPEEEKSGFIDIIQESGNRLLNIINELIEIAKIESGQSQVFPVLTNINEQVSFIFQFFKPEAESKGLQIFQNAGLPDHEVTIITDKEKLYAILTNLVKNAIKYSKVGTILIGYEKKESFLEFYVKDNGTGISPEKQAVIFDRFIQAENADKSSVHGVGLGLSITRAYVEMLGGKIWLESEPGKGSSFYFTLPLTPPSGK